MRLLEGKTKEEVIQILGTDGMSTWSEVYLSYIVGTNYIDPWVLSIIFEDRGRVKDCKIVDG